MSAPCDTSWRTCWHTIALAGDEFCPTAWNGDALVLTSESKAKRPATDYHCNRASCAAALFIDAVIARANSGEFGAFAARLPVYRAAAGLPEDSTMSGFGFTL